MSDEVREKLRDRLARAFPGRESEELPATAHAREALPELAIVRFAPRAQGEAWVYASLGAFAATEGEPIGTEFLIYAPAESGWHVDTLSTAAYFHGFYGLDAGKTLKVGRGWLEGSEQTRMLVTARGVPLELAAIEAGEKRRVQFLRLLPITPAEEDVARRSGAAALERVLEAGPLVKERLL